MKKIAFLSVALCAVLISCKKEKENNNNPGPLGPEPIKFWAISMDSSKTLSVSGGFLNSNVSLNPGERTKVYERTPGAYTLLWAQSSPIDTTYTVLIADTPYKEVTVLIRETRGSSPSVSLFSTCSQPKAGNALVRFVGFKGYDELKAVQNSSATVIKPEVWDNMNDRLLDACNEIQAGTYDLVSTSSLSLPQQNLPGINFKNGGVYMVYIGYDSKIHVVER